MSGYLVDTNVISALRRGARIDAHVSTWAGQRNRQELYLSTITLAELRRSIALLNRKDPTQAAVLARWADQVERDLGAVGHLLGVGAAEARAWGDLMALRPLSIMDAFLAATAQVHGLTLATRNEADFAGLPVNVENPWK